jgi:hypothetical protein
MTAVDKSTLTDETAKHDLAEYVPPNKPMELTVAFGARRVLAEH